MISIWMRAKIWAMGKIGATQALDAYLTRLEMAAMGPRSRLSNAQKILFKRYLKRTRERWIKK